VDDPDVEVVDEQDDVGSGVGPADADVEEAALVAERDLALFVDDVVADAVVVVELAADGGSGLGQRVVDGGRGGAVWQRAVWALLVVEGAKEVKEGLELDERGWLAVLSAQPAEHGLLEAFDLSAGGGVVGSGVLLADVEASELGL
jgi:hypothetical protein